MLVLLFFVYFNVKLYPHIRECGKFIKNVCAIELTLIGLQLAERESERKKADEEGNKLSTLDIQNKRSELNVSNYKVFSSEKIEK